MLNNKFSKCIYTLTKSGEKLVGYLKNINVHHLQRKCYSSTVSNNKQWSVLFFGTDEFALKSLQALHNANRKDGLLHRLEIVTAYKGFENATLKYAKKHNIKIHNWPVQINEKEFDIGVVVSFGYLIPSKIIEKFPLGMINVHGSLLPRWRGAAPICHSLMNGDTRTGVSIMKIMPKKFDIGSVMTQKEIDICPDDTYIELYDKLGTLGANTLIETMYKLPHILNNAKPQIDEEVTYAPKITKEMSFIKWDTMTAENIYNLQRALNGIHTLRTYLKNQVIKLLGIKVAPKTAIIKCAQPERPGLAIYDKENNVLYVHCYKGTWITVEKVTIPHKKPMSAKQFANGYVLIHKEKSCIFYSK